MNENNQNDIIKHSFSTKFNQIIRNIFYKKIEFQFLS